MLGWCTDFLRLWWGLIYWNTRKSWFQIRRGQSSCPCQSPSDSGRAYETMCEASIPWSKQSRFRRVCPLLVETKDGLRCSANTPEVRPFWGRAAGIYGGALLALYLVAVLGTFIFLRTVGYPVSILQVGLPPLWHKIGQARGWFFLDRSNKAFAEGKSSEGLLYLKMSYDYDPQNYVAGLALAKNLQAGQPRQSDEIFQQLLREHPDKRHATAQDWFRALIARGSFEQVAQLAQEELLSDADHAAVWVRALIVVTRLTHDEKRLRELLTDPAPAAQLWRRVLEVELLLRSQKAAEARAAIERPWPPGSPSFTLFFRVNALIELKDSYAALDLLEKYPTVLDEEERRTLRLDAYAVSEASARLRREVDVLLAQRLTLLNLSIVKILCAHLIRHPNPAIFERVWQKVEREQIPLNTDTAGTWFSLLCTAGAVGDKARLQELTARLKGASKTPFVALSIVEAFFRGETAEKRIMLFLPILPLPLEVTYAMIERYAPATAPPSVTVPKKS